MRQTRRVARCAVWAELTAQRAAHRRKALDQRFAVLLMRSGYEAMDALDFMATDKFQVGA